MTETKNILEAQGFRLSPIQKHLWTLSSAGDAAYYVCGIFKAKKILDLSLLRQAIEQVVNAQEILRTSLKTHRNFRFPLQVISGDPDFHFEETDISDLTEIQRTDFIGESVDKSSKFVNILPDNFPPLKINLLKNGESLDTILIFLPAYFCDRAGLVNLTSEISKSYESLEQHREYESDIPQFADISEWQNENLESEEAEAGRNFWKNSQQLFSQQQILPAENKTADSKNFQPASIEGVIAGDLFDRLKEESRSAGVSVEAWLLGCFDAILFKYLDSSEIVAGVGFDGRDFPELKQSLGNLTKYLPVNAAINPETGFIEFASGLEKSLNDARQWQDGFSHDLPVDDGTDADAQLFWNCCLDFYDARETEQTGENIFETVNIYSSLDRFRLCFDCFFKSGSAGLTLKFDPALYSQVEAEKLFAQFLKTVSITTANPSVKLREINFITEREKSFLTEQVNDTFFDYGEKRHFHKLFETQAEAVPQAVAVVCGEREITYRELNSKSNQIAENLISQGVKPDDIVGIYLFPTADFIISLLGVLKAGAGYLPLDPVNPLQRLAYMANDAKPKIIITQEKLIENNLEWQCPQIIIDRLPFSEEDFPNPEISIDEENLAYLIYTSGSTGNPKGVVINHRGLTNYLQWCLHNYGLDKGDGVPVHSSTGFDLSITGIMSPLIAGKKVYLLGENSSVTSLIDLIESNNDFSFIKVTPSHLEILKLLLSEKALSAIKLLIIGGEALYGESFETWRGGSSDIVIINEYGPTETVVGCITFEKKAGEIEPGNVPIGRPIKNTEVYLLDERMNLVPAGVAGEIYLGGAGLARGYWNRAALTAERFVPHPFGRGGERLYRTGDLGRYLGDGQIEYLGRADRQVKIRGYRVELGEIEGQIRMCPPIADTIVDVKTDFRGDKQLVCYYVLSDGQSAGAQVIQEFLKDKLPDYMIPLRYLELENIPLTANGKVDRDKLPELVAENDNSEKNSNNDINNPVKELLKVIWEEILGVQVQNYKSNFFELGGHSLLATQLISRIRNIFGVELDLAVIFDHPFIASLADHLAARMSADGGEIPPPILSVSKDQPLPLSFAQQRMWFLNQLEGAGGNYNISFPLLIKGVIDLPALERSIDYIKSRHDVLRTTFDLDLDGNLFQKIAPGIEATKIRLIDLSDRDYETAHAAARSMVDEHARRRFDLAGGELFDAVLIGLRENERVLMITMHHIVSDGWSTGIFIRELAAAYSAFLSGSDSAAPDLPDLPVQYADYAVWQREYLSAQRLAAQLDFWRGRLGAGGGSAPLDLPLDYPRPLVRSFSGAKRWIELTGDLTARLREVSRAANATLFMTLTAAFKILLARASRQTDISVGIPVANRSRGETENLIGFFVNTLVIRSEVDGADSFGEYLERIRRGTLEAYANQDIPFEKLVEELRPERDMSRTPLFQVMMVMQNAGQEKLELPGMELSGFGLEQKTAKFDLTLTIDEAEGEGLAAGMEYNTDLFTAETIERLLHSFHQLLVSITTDTTQKIQELKLLPEEERRRQIEEWSGRNDSFDSVSDYPLDELRDEPEEPRLTAAALFERQVDRTPDHTAVVTADGRMSYAELDESANRLARYLRAKKIGTEDRVGIMLERSSEMVTAVLAVFKCGAVYMPLDAGYPAERLAYMIEDAEPSLIITEKALEEQLPWTTAEVVRLDEIGGEVESQSGERLTRSETGGASETAATNKERVATVENGAYMIYTSGSTGKPKGVMVTHAGLRTLAEEQGERFGVSEESRVLQFASLSFDASIFDISMAVFNGGTLYLTDRETILPGQRMADYLRDNKISIMTLTPTALAALPFTDLPFLKVINVAGEACSLELAERWSENREFLNLYGPTEATIWATVLKFEKDAERMSIGRPIRNTEVYLLDERMNLVPAGVAGELYLGGAGLARGYWNRAGLTAERFVPHPFGRGGERLYRTGDLGKYLADGRIEYLGRIDRQVKIRGYRVELGEIETTLRTMENIREAIVEAAEDEKGNMWLTAYLVSDKPDKAEIRQSFNITQIREYLQERLPNFMIPGRYLELENIPLTANGKVDRQKLAEFSVKELEGESAKETEKHNPSIELMVNIWEELLGTTIKNVNDSFFDLGGHSLLATQLISRIRNIFGVELDLAVIFDHPFIASLADHLAARMSADGGEIPPPILSVSKDQPLPLSFAQQRMWFLNQLEGAGGNYNISFPLLIKGVIDLPALERSIDYIKSRHDVLRTTFDLDLDGNLFQKIAPGIEATKIRLIDLSDRDYETAHAAARSMVDEHARRRFDLAGGELFDAVLIGLRENERVLMITMHHIVSDGWSTGIFIRELAAAYSAFLSGSDSAAPDLPDLPVQYADYAVWQREYLSAQRLAAQLDFWRGRLGAGGGSAALDLPLDYPRPLVRSFSGAKRWIELTGDLTARLREVSRAANATLFMTLTAAFKILLARASRQTDISVGIPVANRSRGETENLIGFFVNTLVIRSEVDGADSFGEYLERIRRGTLEAYANQDIPFEKLVEELRPERDMSRTPLFQVMMVMQNAGQEKLELPGMELSGFGLEQKTAKFDLTLTIDEAEGEGLAAGMEYNTDLFTAETIERLLHSFHQLLDEVITEPNRQLSELEFFGGEENFFENIASERRKIEIQKAAESDENAGNWQTINAEYVPLTTETEYKIAEIWSEVLGVSKIGKNDDFFHLGGHSLLVIQVVTRVRNIFETEISIKSLFDHSKLFEFAEFVESSAEGGNNLEMTIPVQENLEYYPLSFGQKRLWFIQQLEPQNTAYNVSITLKLEGKLQIDLIDRAFALIVERHATLRTKFVVINGSPFQQILPLEKYSIETADYRNVAENVRDEKINERIVKIMTQPFDLSEGNLFRGILISVSDEENILHLTIHHIASDGLSMNILVNEFSEIYSALANDRKPNLPEIRVKYADYGFWQDKDFREGKLTEKIEFWKEAIGKNPPVLEFPTDKTRPRMLSGKSEQYQLVLPERLRQRASEFSRKNEITPFMFYLSALFVLLSKYTGQDEILIGTPIANRNRIELEALVGFFINTLVIKENFSDSSTFSDIVKSVKNNALFAFVNQDIPFEMLVEEIQPTRSINRHPVFQVMFAYRYNTDEKLDLPGLKVSDMEIGNKKSQFDFSLTVFETDTETGVEIEYSTDLFVQETMRRLSSHFQILLEKFLESPGEKLSRISLLDENERKAKTELLKPKVEGEKNLLFHRLFEEQVLKTPNAVALIQDDESLTYAELNSKANQLAAYLQAKGIGADKMVCVYQNRSIQMIISLLAVIKAGGACIPLEPDTPVNRVNTILSEVPDAFVISESLYIDSLDAAGENKLDLETDRELISKMPAENLGETSFDENTAYLIYTSGSTGKPKGVMIPHRALCNYILWMKEFTPYEPGQTQILSTSLSFDVSICEFYKPLICGAAVVVVNTKQQLNLEYLVGQIRKHNVSILYATPTFLKYFLQHPDAGQCGSLERAFSAGETLTYDILELFHKTLPHCSLFNSYGPTETTVVSTITYEKPELDDEKIYLGKVIPNESVYILDNYLNLVPDGVPGELYVGGVGLARGYFNRPIETAGNFIPDPFSGDTGARIYRTGDFGRYLPDGNIEFLGRKDQQVKINGQRLELSEIEILCMQIPGIKQTIVDLRELNGKDILVGFMVSENGEKIADGDIKSFLRSRLPEYMIPASIQWIDAVPMTINGKVDRKNLKAVFTDEPGEKTETISPQTDVQKKIVSIWQEVLENDDIGLHDNFFDIGGHSLLLVEVLEKINDGFDKNITILDLFIHTTVESLAEFLTVESEENKLADVKQQIEKRQNLTKKNRDLRKKRLSDKKTSEN